MCMVQALSLAQKQRWLFFLKAHVKCAAKKGMGNKQFYDLQRNSLTKRTFSLGFSLDVIWNKCVNN